MEQRILLVDDEADILEFISYNLIREGYQVYTATNGKEAVAKAREVVPHLILLDVMMPEMDGIETCQEIRKQDELKNTLIAFLTARGEDYSQIAGFEAGADDYVVKPFEAKEVIARIKAVLRRFGKNDENQVKEVKYDKVLVSRIKALLKRFETVPNEAPAADRPIVIDRERYLVLKEGKEIVLPRKEFELLALLYSKPQKVFSREEIFSNVWGNDVIVGDRTIDVHVRKLREKLGDHHIVTIKGVGYKYED